MSAMILHEGGLEFHATDGEPRVRDLDLARMLGYRRPREIRPIVIDAQKHKDFGVCCVVRKTHGAAGGRPTDEYWLTQRQALFVTTQSRTERSADIAMLLVDTFLAVRQQLAHAARAHEPLWHRVLDAVLLPAPAEWERMFQPTLVRALCDLYRKKWQGGSHPRWLARPNGKIYDLLCSAAIGAEMRRRNPLPERGRNQHQQFTPEARDYFAAQLKIVEAIARQSENKADFWHRMDREYSAGMLQLSLGGAEARTAVQ